jgi:putative ABC transport system permease protein
MWISASFRKSLTDLSRRRARTAFTVATLALAVASISFLAIPTLIDRAMQEEVRVGLLADATVTMRPLALSAEQLAALEALPNVVAVEPRSSVDTRILVGERRARALVIGVRDFGRQSVDLVRLQGGALPGPGEVATEIQNANVGVYDGRAGDSVTIIGARATPGDAGPARTPLRIAGEARSLPGGEEVENENVIVLYATEATVATLSGEPGYDRLAIRMRDPRPAAAAETVGAVREYLSTAPGFAGFANLPELRAPGEWPGKAETEKFAQFLGVITLLALLSALVLISNTVTTLVAEQTGEIGIMRAIGARRRQVALVYLRTALLLGALAALAGVALGVVLSSLLADYFASAFWAVDVGFGADTTVVLASVAAGVLVPPLAALPAIRRALRVDVREALEATGSTVGGQDAADRLLSRARFLPRSLQIGLRSVGRRKRRSLATALIVALAVGNLLASMSVAAAATESSRTSWANHLEDLRLWTSGREGFDARAEGAITSTLGVAEAQPALVNKVELAGLPAFVWGIPREPLFRYQLAEGRWFSDGEEQGRAPVAVVERNIAEAAGIAVGDEVTLATAAGPAQFRVVGIATNQQEDGTVLYVPLPTLRSVLGVPAGVSTYWIRATSPDHAHVDRTTALLEDRLTALGYDVATEISYVRERDEIAANGSIATSITVLGFLIVAMSMVALANAITMSILERTREVGILRCIGARARDVRRIFTTEAVTLAFVGWLLGVPLGYLLSRLLVRLVWEIAEVRFPVVFPLWNIPLALAGTLVLALLVVLLPVRRAVRYRPGDALRYA